MIHNFGSSLIEYHFIKTSVVKVNRFKSADNFSELHIFHMIRYNFDSFSKSFINRGIHYLIEIIYVYEISIFIRKINVMDRDNEQSVKYEENTSLVKTPSNGLNMTFTFIVFVSITRM